MSDLLRKPKRENISEGVTLIQDVHKKNSMLRHMGFKLIDLKQGAVFKETLENKECCIVALSGKITVSDGLQTFKEIGTRESVFEKTPTDSVYVGASQTYTIQGENEEARVALCYAPASKKLPTTWVKASENTIEHRGKYHNQRLVHNILPDVSTVSENLLVVEVYTESGNFSSYPPHKHDQDNLPHESLLEESYYHEVDPKQGFLFQRVYTDDRTIDETMSVENRDVVLVPKGYHPVGVPDGYTSYYLNVMAGPTKIWKFHNDPDHEWILKRE